MLISPDTRHAKVAGSTPVLTSTSSFARQRLSFDIELLWWLEKRDFRSISVPAYLGRKLALSVESSRFRSALGVRAGFLLTSSRAGSQNPTIYGLSPS